MKYLINTLLGLVTIAMFVACSDIPKGFKLDKNSGIIYKLHQIGEKGKTANVGDYVTINASFSTMNDSVFLINNKKIQIQEPRMQGDFFDCILQMEDGDSTTFLMQPNKFYGSIDSSRMPDFLAYEQYFKISIKIKNIQTANEFENQKRLFMSWCEDFDTYEKDLLKEYINNKKIDIAPSASGMYKLTINEGCGDTPKFGDTVTINYEGRFLNGCFFDSTQRQSSSFEFILGKEWQVIKGFEEAIPTMKEGERAIIIMPSELAFGNRGSSNGIIPPYTSVVYELLIKKIAKGQSNISLNSDILDLD